MVGSHQLLIILVVVLVLFGGAQLPKLARNLARAQKEFQDGVGAPEPTGEGDTGSDPVAAREAATRPLPPPSKPSSG